MSVARELPHKHKPTYADIAALPAGTNGEILGGELVVSSRPASLNARAVSVIHGVLMNAYDLGVAGPGGWWILFEPELSLGVDEDFDPVIPDLAGWRRDTMPTMPVTTQFHSAPQWVCEILSPSTQRHDRVLKVPFYARAGVSHVWLVDPLAQTLEVLRLVAGHWQIVQAFGGDATVRAEPFDAIELPLASLWDRGPGAA